MGVPHPVIGAAPSTGSRHHVELLFGQHLAHQRRPRTTTGRARPPKVRRTRTPRNPSRAPSVTSQLSTSPLTPSGRTRCGWLTRGSILAPAGLARTVRFISDAETAAEPAPRPDRVCVDERARRRSRSPATRRSGLASGSDRSKVAARDVFTMLDDADRALLRSGQCAANSVSKLRQMTSGQEHAAHSWAAMAYRATRDGSTHAFGSRCSSL